ncbi:hypothetical protein RHOFW104T7_17620 [Rhodanobacter thiooxydans]|uniref:Uncharacterized protein n=2 Tax=Rhodanobacter thiooxydans TaxID=416169 RepID=A0A154QEK7_9GAMM|nr:hypothetical protein UUA_09396 [Rhodanobacter thiooxydans LCS2]KZC22629.1 hypothetical protein RHOFW104T7_17620 [Rhodanobacter thiooxydans]
MVSAARAEGVAVRSNADATPPRMAIQVNDDRMTVTLAGAPQIYLYGVIDADAPQRFEALLKSGKVPAGADVYLNSSQGELAAGMALGRLFRASSMTTHLGTPRRKRGGYRGAKAAVCSGACAYAYFGGLYRWAPTGGDRIGLIRHRSAVTAPAQPMQGEADAYLKAMGIDLDALAAPPAPAVDSPIWLDADQMTVAGVANNGRLPLKTKSWLLPPAPSLELHQENRRGTYRLVLQCQPGSVTLTAYDQVGATRAAQIVAHETRSYFEVDRQPVLVEPRGAARVVDSAVVISRPWPPGELGRLLSSSSIGAWVGGRRSAFRYGATFVLYPARQAIKDFYNACWRVAPWPVKQAQEKNG